MSYCKSKNGDIFKVWSDNVEEETMHVYPYDDSFDPEVNVCDVIDYKDILCFDTNLSVVLSFK